ncbi:hypothetical protein [Aureimonas ureilytica]|uniref:hypothetical protein n=1 Tax=Aureimonas ureilytica TaxID=401562 RepID=UPI00073476D8|nr:hypothetical protein [Aureimonas ureilytica]
MALIIRDRVRETSTSSGLGNMTLAGAQLGFKRFGGVMAVGDTTWYTITGPGGSWETGVGTYVAADTLERTTVLDSSNGDAKVNFAAGTKDIFLGAPGKMLLDPAAVAALFANRYTKAEADARTMKVLLANYGPELLLNSTGVELTLPNDFASFEISIIGLAAKSGSGLLFLRYGDGAGYYTGSQEYAMQVYGRDTVNGPLNASVIDNKHGIIALDGVNDNHVVIRYHDGSDGGRASFFSQQVGKTAGGVDTGTSRAGVLNAIGVKKLLGIFSTVQLAQSGRIKIYGVR